MWLWSKIDRDYESGCAGIWQRTYDWDRAASTDEDQYWDELYFDRITVVTALWDSNPTAAFEGFRELAELGSIHGMIWLGQCYEQGHGTKIDFDAAYDSFSRAISAGSWLATLDISSLLFNNGYFDECEEYLEDGIRADYIPAYFWLAWYRIKRSNTRATYRQIKPLLEYAAEKGHPTAKDYFAASMMLGKYGIRETLRGFRMLSASIDKRNEEEAKAADTDARNGALAVMPAA